MGNDPSRPELTPELLWDSKVVALNNALRASGIPYAFGGAICLNYHRDPRSTLDIDVNIFLSPADKTAVLEILTGLYGGLPNAEEVDRRIDRDGQARTMWAGTYVDLFFADTDFHQSMAHRVEHQDFDGTDIPVLSIEDLIVCKVLFDRSKDWLDIQAVTERPAEHLDAAYINRWLGAFITEDDARLVKIRQILSRTD